MDIETVLDFTDLIQAFGHFILTCYNKEHVNKTCKYINRGIIHYVI